MQLWLQLHTRHRPPSCQCSNVSVYAHQLTLSRQANTSKVKAVACRESIIAASPFCFVVVALARTSLTLPPPTYADSARTVLTHCSVINYLVISKGLQLRLDRSPLASLLPSGDSNLICFTLLTFLLLFDNLSCYNPPAPFVLSLVFCNS